MNFLFVFGIALVVIGAAGLIIANILLRKKINQFDREWMGGNNEVR